MPPGISILGSAPEVTGSCFLIEADDVRFLVDCSMFQDGREAQASNRKPLDFDQGPVDFVLLTHEQIDDSDLLPKLIKAGFTGLILPTEATTDLLDGMLYDCVHFQEVDARRPRNKPPQRNADTSVPNCFAAPPRQTFVVHDEEAAALEFADALRTRKGWTVSVPGPGASHSPGSLP